MARSLLTTREVADALRVSVATVTRLVRSGELRPAEKAPGTRGAYLFDPAVVEPVIVQRVEAKA